MRTCARSPAATFSASSGARSRWRESSAPVLWCSGALVRVLACTVLGVLVHTSTGAQVHMSTAPEHQSTRAREHGKPAVIVALGDSTTAGTPAFRSPVEAPPNGDGNKESQFAH